MKSPSGNSTIDVLQIIVPRILDHKASSHFLLSVPPDSRYGVRRSDIFRYRNPERSYILIEPAATIFPAGTSPSRPQVNNMIGAADRLLIVLDNQERIPDVPQIRKRVQQAPVVPG